MGNALPNVVKIVSGTVTILHMLSPLIDLLKQMFSKQPDEACPVNITKEEINKIKKMHGDIAQETGGNEEKINQRLKGLEDLCRKQAELSQKLAEAQTEFIQKLDDIKVHEEELKVEQEKIKIQPKERHKERDDDTIASLRRLAFKKLDLDSINEYNVAINGQSGSGKSTLINGFCDFRPDDPQKAPVGVNECTHMIKKYPNPYLERLKLWDCPGGGTEAHPRDTYFYDKFLYAFDYLLFVFTDRLTETEIDLMKQAIAHKVPFALVRNKANYDFESKRRDDARFKALSKREAIELLINDHHEFMQKSLRDAGIDKITPLFVINAWALTDADEIQFEEAKLAEHVLTKIYKRRNQQTDGVISQLKEISKGIMEKVLIG